MSKAVICDKCKTACAEQSATRIETKWQFVTTYLDEFREFIYGRKDNERKAD